MVLRLLSGNSNPVSQNSAKVLVVKLKRNMKKKWIMPNAVSKSTKSSYVLYESDILFI